MEYLKHWATIIVLASLAGCSYIYGSDHAVIVNRDTDYLKAKSIPPMKIPPGMSSSTIEAHYPVSDREYPESNLRPSLIPPGLNNS